MTLIRQDAAGLYIKVDGYIARPDSKYPTKYTAGEKVVTRHPPGPYVKVGKKKDGREFWPIERSYL